MRLLFITFLFISSTCSAQEKKDSVSIQSEPEWSATNYTQEDKIYNRSVWTFADNPALAGFDRKLAVAYRFGIRNLGLGVPNEDGNLVLGFMRHEASIDMPFGGPKQNWGMGVHYSHEKEFLYKYHQVEIPTSLRIQFPKNHNLILGLAIGIQFSKLDSWSDFTFGDMIDPRHGFVYPTNEVRRNDRRTLGYFRGGIRYYWKRLAFDYSVQHGPHGTWALAGAPTLIVRNKLHTTYHINVGDGVTISPAVVADVLTTYGTFYPNGPDDSWVFRATNNFALVSGFATISYKDMVYGQLGILDHNRLSIKAGYQLKDMLVIEAGVSSYVDQTMEKIGGLAGVEGSIRYQIRAWAK